MCACMRTGVCLFVCMSARALALSCACLLLALGLLWLFLPHVNMFPYAITTGDQG